MDATNITNAPI